MGKKADTSKSADSAAVIEPTGLGHDDSTGLASYTPGSAFIYKGEPSATELGMLRFDLTSHELEQLHGIVTEMMNRYEDLGKSDEGAAQKHFDTVVKKIEQDELALPLKIDLSAPDRYYSTEVKSSSLSGRTSSFVRLLRRLDPRRIGGN